MNFKVNTYKHIDTIRDGYLIRRKKTRPLIYYYLNNFKKEYYDKCNTIITDLIKDIKDINDKNINYKNINQKISFLKKIFK